MEIGIVSKEIVKPSSPINMKPFKISLLDQLTPTTFSPLIFFYPMKDIHHFKDTEISTQLKKSLSKTLTHFYPLSGRVKDNLIVDNFDKGVPFIEARVNGINLSEFLQKPQMELLNKFLPYPPFCYQLPDLEVPQVAVQLNIFDGGGIALGICNSHKIIDGGTASTWLKTWSSIARGAYCDEVEVMQDTDLSKASTMFPPLEVLPKDYLSLLENFWSREGNYKTKRFVFDAEAIANLRAKATDHEHTMNMKPTRYEALSAFIWKYATMASRSAPSAFCCQRPSVFNQPVNIRRLTKPRMPTEAIGNLVMMSNAIYNWDDHQQKEGVKLHELVAQIRIAKAKIKSDSVLIPQHVGDGMCIALRDALNQLEKLSKINHDVFIFSNLIRLGFNELDFGWGIPIWTAMFGEAGGSGFANVTFLREIGSDGKAVEAWITFEDRIMSILENDPHFMAFASLNPSIYNNNNN